MPRTQNRIAAIGGAGIAIIRHLRGALAAAARTVAPFVTVARIAIRTSHTLGFYCMDSAQKRIAQIVRARVAMINAGRNPWNASPGGVALFNTIARVPIRAGSDYAGRNVHGADRWIAAIGGARVAIINACRSPRNASTGGVALFNTIARVPIRTRSDNAGGYVHGASRRVATIDGAGIPVIRARRRPRNTSASGITSFISVTQVRIRAGDPSRQRSEHGLTSRVAAILGARVPVGHGRRVAAWLAS